MTIDISSRTDSKSWWISGPTKAEEAQLKQLKCRWSNVHRGWFTSDRRVARAFPSECWTPAMREEMEAHDGAVAASHKSDTDYMPPCPPGRKFFPFQRAGIEYAKSRRFTLFGDPMGLGKSSQAVGTVNAVGAVRVLVLCPASLKLNWLKELRMWSTRRRLAQVIHKGDDIIHPQVDTVIVNYDLVAKAPIHRQLSTKAWDAIILDEVHYLKNPQAKRTAAVLGTTGRKLGLNPLIFRLTPHGRLLALSGTPLPNRPIELFPLLTAASPAFKHYTYAKFATHFCSGFIDPRTGAWNTTGASNLDELNTLLRTHHMVRREKADVLKDLPEKIYQVIPLPPPGTKTAAGLALRDLRDYHKDAVKGSSGAVPFEDMARLRKVIALEKLTAGLSHLEDVLEELGEGKVVVFGHHHEVLDAIEKRVTEMGVGFVRVDGGTPVLKRQAAVDTFQNKPEVRVFIGQIQAAGVGLTLTAASTVLFLEASWVPGENEQAVDRCHRIGQKNTVTAQFLVYEGTIDADILKTSLTKHSVINQVLA